MKSRITHIRSVKAVTLTAFASLCLVNCNGNGDYGKAANNDAVNQKAALLAKKAIDTATTAGLAGTWNCDQAQSEKLYNSGCNGNHEQLVISPDLTTMTEIMEINEQSDGQPTSSTNQTGVEEDCYYNRSNELKLADTSSPTDFTGSLVLGNLNAVDVDGSSASDICQNAAASQKAAAPAPAPVDQKHKRSHSPAKPANMANVELTLQGSAGSYDELVVKVTKNSKKTVTLLFTRASDGFDPNAPIPTISGMPNPLPSLPAPTLPKVVVAPQPATIMGVPNTLPVLPAPALPIVKVAPASEQDAAVQE